MFTSKLEVLVDYSANIDDECVKRTLKDLKGIEGIKQVQYQNGAYMVETVLPTSDILDIVSKTTGRRTVLQGFGESQSGVSMVSDHSADKRVMGIVRFQQTEEGPLVVDGTIDGLTPGPHSLSIHETGDLSGGCNTIGPVYDTTSTEKRDQKKSGDLGEIVAGERGRAAFRIINENIKIWDIIGRSVAVTEKPQRQEMLTQNTDDWVRVACGIIARSAGIFQNPKRICACDGVVVWDERDRPLAGAGRRTHSDGQKKHNERCCCK